MMSKYDKYKIQNLQDSPLSKYAQYKIMPTKQESPSFFERVGQLAKGALSGFTRSGLEEAGKQAKYGVMDVGRGVVPISESSAMANIPEKGIEALESMKPNKNDSLGNILYHAGEFGGGVGSFPILPGRAASSGAKSLFSRFGKDIGAGTAIGAGSGVLQEGGINPLVADVASSVVTPTLKPQNLLNVFKKTGETAAKVPMKIMGLSPKGLNIEAARAARDLNIDLPAATLTNSKLTGLADQYVGKAPIFGEMIGKKYANAEAQTKKALEKIYNEVGPKETPEVEALISKLYKERTESLPKGANVKPKHLKEAIDNIKIDSALLSSDEKSLLDALATLRNEIEPQSKLVSQFGQIKIPLQEFDVNKLIGTKTSLNNIIKWGKDEGVKNQLRSVQHAITKDIAEYGKMNPEWYKTFKKADKLYGDVAKREKLESLLGHKSTNYATEDLSYNALAKAINNPKNAESIKKQLTPETFEKIQKLGTVAKAMAIKNKNIPNPSGTATTAAVSAVIYGLASNPLKTIPTVAAGYGLTKLLTDKKFLDLALKYAENPSKPNLLTTTALNKRIQDITGYSAVALQNALNNKAQNSKEE